MENQADTSPDNETNEDLIRHWVLHKDEKMGLEEPPSIVHPTPKELGPDHTSDGQVVKLTLTQLPPELIQQTTDLIQLQHQWHYFSVQLWESFVLPFCHNKPEQAPPKESSESINDTDPTDSTDVNDTSPEESHNPENSKETPAIPILSNDDRYNLIFEIKADLDELLNSQLITTQQYFLTSLQEMVKPLGKWIRKGLQNAFKAANSDLALFTTIMSIFKTDLNLDPFNPLPDRAAENRHSLLITLYTLKEKRRLLLKTIQTPLSLEDTMVWDRIIDQLCLLKHMDTLINTLIDQLNTLLLDNHLDDKDELNFISLVLGYGHTLFHIGKTIQSLLITASTEQKLVFTFLLLRLPHHRTLLQNHFSSLRTKWEKEQLDCYNIPDRIQTQAYLNDEPILNQWTRPLLSALIKDDYEILETLIRSHKGEALYFKEATRKTERWQQHESYTLDGLIHILHQTAIHVTGASNEDIDENDTS